MTSNWLRGAVGLSHFHLGECVKSGDRVVDATCGNGHDTLFLAQRVGSGGKVWAFDVQQQALTATRELLTVHGCHQQVELVSAGHEQLADHVTEPVQAVVFNLGYLPGSDKSTITEPSTTLAGLEQALSLLLPGGIVSIALYTGHPGGQEEAMAVENWAAGLSSQTYHVWSSRQLNRSSSSPYLIIIEKAHS